MQSEQHLLEGEISCQRAILKFSVLNRWGHRWRKQNSCMPYALHSFMILVFFIKLANESNNHTGDFHLASGVRTVIQLFTVFSFYLLRNINHKSKNWVFSVTSSNQLILCFPLIWYNYCFKIAVYNGQQSPSQHKSLVLT